MHLLTAKPGPTASHPASTCGVFQRIPEEFENHLIL